MEYKNTLLRNAGALAVFFETRLNALLWWLLAGIGWGIARVAQLWLDGFYARSQFPVPFYAGQTTFNGEELKGYYAHMIERGTLDIYWQTQQVDFVFMAASCVFLVLLVGASYRVQPDSLRRGYLGKIGRIMLWLVPLAPLFDALENGISFIMLSDPTEFANAWVYPYSAFAVVKFALFALGYLWAILSLLIAVLYGLWKLFRGTGGVNQLDVN